MSHWNLLKKIFFTQDPERIHGQMCFLLRLMGRTGLLKALPAPFIPKTPSMVFGKHFLSPIGLAAGFDKNAELLSLLPRLGFGFAEIGTVTPKPQDGNPKPRLFRLPNELSLFNRMGFNGDGAEKIAHRLEKAKPELPKNFRVGLNIGKNKATPPDEAYQDYEAACIPFFKDGMDLADYVVVNVSSPNTPGLRDLQNTDDLKKIVSSVRNVIAGTPLLLKLAPELKSKELCRLIVDLEIEGVDGWVLTNTLEGCWNSQKGGFSGQVLGNASYLSLKTVRSVSQKPIISVGGISTTNEAIRRKKAGADLLQVYTGWIYGGPVFPMSLARAVAKIQTKADPSG